MQGNQLQNQLFTSSIQHEGTPSHTSQGSPDSQVAELMNELAFAIKHDLQSPVRYIANYLDLLEKELESNKLNEDSQKLFKRAQENLHILKEQQQVLTTYLTADSRAIEPEQFSVDAFLRNKLEEFSSINRFNVSASLRRVDFYGDKQILGDVIDELFNNALRFVKEDELPQISLHLDYSHTQISIQLEDEGIGFSMHQKDRLFKLFQTLHSRMEYKMVGLGSGLAVAQKLAGRLGGSILPYSEPNKGSSFTLVLPR